MIEIVLPVTLIMLARAALHRDRTGEGEASENSVPASSQSDIGA